MTAGSWLEVPGALADSHATYFGDGGRAWIAALPRLAAECMECWSLRPDGLPLCGAVALVLPVLLVDGTAAVLKLQPVDVETGGEPVALRAWEGHGAVRLIRHDPGSGAMLLDRLDAARTLAGVEDDLEALRILSGLLVRLNAVPAPPGMRQLVDIAGAMLERVPRALAVRAERDWQRLVRRCAGAVEDLLPSAGSQLLHWDLHYDNVLGTWPGDGREPWLAIDPKPLGGEPGFELLAALHNRWGDVVASGDVARAVRVRFDLMTEVLGLDRRRAAGWTLGRVLQNMLWEVDNGDTSWHTGPDEAVARALLSSC